MFINIKIESQTERVCSKHIITHHTLNEHKAFTIKQLFPINIMLNTPNELQYVFVISVRVFDKEILTVLTFTHFQTHSFIAWNNHKHTQ